MPTPAATTMTESAVATLAGFPTIAPGPAQAIVLSLLVLEDAAQAHGALYRGRRAGSLGAAAAFSFYPSKNLGALGDGGAVCTNDEVLATRLRSLRHLGQRAKGEHVDLGYNERLDGLQAALLRVKLAHLDNWNDARRSHAARYRELLPPAARLLGERPESPCIYHIFPARFENRDAIAATAPRSRNRDGRSLHVRAAWSPGLGRLAAASWRPARCRGVGDRGAVAADASRSSSARGDRTRGRCGSHRRPRPQRLNAVDRSARPRVGRRCTPHRHDQHDRRAAAGL